MHEVINSIGDKVLKDLVECYFSQTPYYLSNRVNYLFKNEEDALFTTNEEIIEHVKKLLSEKYSLQVTSVQRILKSQDPDGEDFPFGDIELKIVKL